MKKTLLAAALMAGFAGIAQAETSVTLYGIIDAGIGYDRVKTHANGEKQTRTGLLQGVQSGNRWGLKGTEDLGNGLRATFQLESGFELATGNQLQGDDSNDRLFGRWATLGLAGDSWGRLDMGRQTTVGSQYFVDVHGQHWDGTGSTRAFRGQDTNRIDNSIIYQTPNFSGFQAGVGYSFQANGGQVAKVSGDKDLNKSAVTTGIRYANGPVAVAASYDQVRLQTGPLTNKYKNAQTWAVSGSYDFEVVALSLAFGQDFNGSYTTAYGNSRYYNKNFDYNNYAVALAFPIGEGKLSGEYSMKQPRKAAKDAGEKKQHAYSLAYKHPLSKRTDVYAVGGYVKNLNNQNKDTRTVAGVGLTHRF